ncbi:hypothetical protein [Pyxidicoccus sp. MSG2]|uniref:hypothetical protein n=1 Tax=Pyxidicoccus sp. MSG2 TaxID=2996790 RepID=UPI00226E1DC2|nr:hypothetical protein [Pyxidicoccus sp. MSG2]MCY1016352.1 hypothetical protein [Pyxidicoccus sp. MSG2]
MTKNLFKTALAVVSVGSLMSGCDFEQPEAGCFVQDSTSWAMKYDLVGEPKLADGTACTAVPPEAEPVGVFKFVDPDHPDNAVLTLRPAGLAALALRDPGASSLQTATGKLASEADAEDFCAATDFSVATVDAAPAGTAPRTTITYAFSNVRVYSAPSAPGTQLTGELKYTKDGCTSTYVARAQWPAIPCDPESDVPAETCGVGSGLNPDFAVTCAPNAHLCVPAKSIPSFVDSAN